MHVEKINKQLNYPFPSSPWSSSISCSFHRIRSRGVWVRYGRRPWRLVRRIVRRLKMYVRGKLRWIYPRKGRLMVHYKRKGRPIRFRRGRPRIWNGKKWKSFRQRKTYVKMRLRYGGRWRLVKKWRGRWTMKYRGKRRRVTLRGRRFGIRIGGRWRYIPSRGGALQLRYGRMWRRVRNCCNKLRAVLRGRLRRIRLRYGKARMRGRKGWTKLLRKAVSRFSLRKFRGMWQ